MTLPTKLSFNCQLLSNGTKVKYSQSKINSVCNCSIPCFFLRNLTYLTCCTNFFSCSLSNDSEMPKSVTPCKENLGLLRKKGKVISGMKDDQNNFKVKLLFHNKYFFSYCYLVALHSRHDLCRCVLKCSWHFCHRKHRTCLEMKNQMFPLSVVNCNFAGSLYITSVFETPILYRKGSDKITEKKK